MVDFEKLTAPFPQEAVSWRAQTVTKDGTKAMALAYIDARDVMNRLDEVCSPAGWQCKYSHANGKTVCDIGIRVFGPPPIKDGLGSWEWVWKADGAGDSDIEAEKGALSDAFKRAAVRWGIGRYLYNMEAVWVPCESREYNGKHQFVKFTTDPWALIKKTESKAVFKNASLRKTYCDNVIASYESCESVKELNTIIELNKAKFEEMRGSGNEHDSLAVDELQKRYKLRLTVLKEAENEANQLNQLQNDFKERA